MISGKVVLGALAGVAAGAMVGVLFAPDKGSETRRKIAKKTGDYAHSVKDGFSSLINGTKEKVEKMADEAKRAAEDLKQRTAKA